MNTELVPFGKYKGQPLEVLQNDKPYLEWLQTQDWFKERYQQINTVIINNFTEPSETPEHNRLCNIFLEEKNCWALFEIFKKDFNIKSSYTDKVRKKAENKVVPFVPGGCKIPSLKDSPIYVPSEDEYEIVTFTAEWQVSKAVFEDKGIDVCFYVYACEYNINFRPNTFKIEVKPCIGDDYPAILRQINNNGSNFLIAEKFTSTAASLEQVKEIFKRSNKIVYLLSEFL
ncbi:MAG TPA: hypothetical protein VN922_24660 [Bacteroidia bacterium]|nr:hypothetical protein [Bacteroidia bacterium]